MFLHSLFVFSIALISITNEAVDVDQLARYIMTEGAIGNRAEQIAIGFACQQNPNCASDKDPTPVVTQLAAYILEGRIYDPTNGANRWFSPTRMPKESQKSLCRDPIGSGILDCDGGLQVSCGITERYRPGWATPDKQVNIRGVRNCSYRFFKL